MDTPSSPVTPEDRAQDTMRDMIEKRLSTRTVEALKQTADRELQDRAVARQRHDGPLIGGIGRGHW